MNEDDYQMLLSDEVFVAGVAASDVQALWRALARSEGARKVARGLASEPARIRGLCRFVERLLEKPYERGFRHPHDIAICAALVILEQSPLPEVRHLFARLKAAEEPSLAWVRRTAEYCDQRFAEAPLFSHFSQQPGTTITRFVPCETPDVKWADPNLQRRRYCLRLT